MKKTKGLWRTLLFVFLITALCGNFALPVGSVSVNAAPQLAPSTTIIISQIYGGGGNSGAPYTNDFIELFNLGTSPVSLSGWSVQYAGATSTSWAITNLTGSLAPGQYYLVQLSGGTGCSGNPCGMALPAAQATGTMNMAANAGKVALMNTTIALTGSGCPFAANVVDFIGYGTGGSGADCFEGSGSAPTLSNTTSALRSGNSCTDTDNNVNDFTATTPAPRNSSSTLALCMDPLTVTAVANLTGTASAENLTATASAVNATNTSIALTGTATSTPTNTSTPTSTQSSGSATNVVISEFRTRGPDGANDEFIELYNPTANAINISGWKISASSSTGATKTTKATIPSSTLLQSGQYYLVVNNNSSGGYSIASVTGNLSYTSSIADDGGIALLKSDGTTIVDQVGMSSTTAYKEGSPLAKLSTDADQSYERKLGGASDSCQDTNNNANDFFTTPSDPHNYSTPLSRCGTRLTLRSSSTTITSDTPYTSAINAKVTIHVKVTGGTPIPTGKVVVTVTGTTLTCTANLNASGIGGCDIKFTTLGTKTIVAVYLGDSVHAGSMYTTTHYVSTSTTSYYTPTPAPPPPPQLVAINEFVPRPGHDWNHDGVVNVGDEYIELLNHGTVDVNLSGYSLDDEVNVGSNPYRLPAKVLRPGERVVFYGSETGLLLGDGGDGVRLLKPNGQLMDAYNYTVARYPDESYCRLPDNGGADDWNQYCFPTPGLQNSLSGDFVPSSNGIGGEPSCPISDTLPDAFVQAECDPFGNNIWRPEFWDKTGWYDEKNLPLIDGKWPVFAD